MEQATLSDAAAGTPRTAFPPGSRLPAIAQAVRYSRGRFGFLNELQRRHGDMFTVSLPHFGKLVYVAHPALIKAVFTGPPARFHAGEANASVVEPALGPNSIITLDEGLHMRQRKLLLPPFHGDRIRHYGDLVREVTVQEMESWPVGRPFALFPHTQRITLTVIMRAVFGVDDKDRLTRFERLVDTFARSVENPFTAFPPFRRDLGRWSPWARFLRARKALDEFIYEEISIRRSEVGAEHAERDDVLSLLLAARHDDGSPMSDEELRDELVTVLGAGHDTTAAALAWAIERLLRSPRALRSLRESLAEGEDSYLDATIKETLRARPAFVDVARKLTEPTRLGDYTLPAGTFVMAAIGALHHREDLFPDPDEFRPERFLDDKPDTYVWIPFGGGVRRCIGASFAEYEMRVVLRTILERADLSAPDPKPERLRVRYVTLLPGEGTRVSLAQPC